MVEISTSLLNVKENAIKVFYNLEKKNRTNPWV